MFLRPRSDPHGLLLTRDPEKLGRPVLGRDDVIHDAAEGDVDDARHQHRRQHDQDILRDERRLLAGVLGRRDPDAITESLHCVSCVSASGR